MAQEPLQKQNVAPRAGMEPITYAQRYSVQGRSGTAAKTRNIQNPPHASTESNMAPTSEFTRYFLLAYPSRYILRGLFGMAFESKLGSEGSASFFNRVFHPLRERVDTWVDRATLNHHFDTLQNALSANRLDTLAEGKIDWTPPFAGELSEIQAAIPAKHKGMTVDRLLNTLRSPFYREPHKTTIGTALSTDTGKTLLETIKRVSHKSGVHLSPDKLVGEAYEQFPGRSFTQPVLSDNTKNYMRTEVKKGLNALWYGNALAAGSLALTASYSRMVYRDILNLFSEAVALEMGKEPEDVTFSDIRHSHNQIVQSTVSNWFSRTFARLSTDGLFSLSAFTRSNFAVDLALGVKAFQILYETWQREPTMFEQLTTLVNQKLNPKNGLGQPITVGDVFDLYQHYTTMHNPKRSFHSVIETDPAEGRAWQQGRPVFQRIAELLNQTYTYKHDVALDGKGNPISQADFALPKLIYLLGHNLIDPYKPKESLLYIEVINHHGAQAVKEVQTGLAKGKTVEQLMGRYLGSSTMAEHMQTAHSYAAPTAPSPKLAPQGPLAARQVEALRTNALQHIPL